MSVSTTFLKEWLGQSQIELEAGARARDSGNGMSLTPCLPLPQSGSISTFLAGGHPQTSLQDWDGSQMYKGSQFPPLPKCSWSQITGGWKCALRALGSSLADTSESPSQTGTRFIFLDWVPRSSGVRGQMYSEATVLVLLKLGKNHSPKCGNK